MIKAMWKDPVWSKVIATAILASFGIVGAYVLNLWPAIASHAASSLAFATSNTAVANWLIGLVGLLALPTIFLVVVVLWQLVFPSRPPTPNWQSYLSDEFFGLHWRWQYFGGTMSDMHTFCPHCDFQVYPSRFQVYPSRASSYVAVDRIAFHCESCNRQLGTFDEAYDSLENKAKRFAQQKIRSESWNVQSGSYGSFP